MTAEARCNATGFEDAGGGCGPKDAGKQLQKLDKARRGSSPGESK